MKQLLTTYHKKTCFLMLCCIFTSLLSVAQVSKSVTITAGGLASKLTEIEKNTITNLTISGTIDARDFKTMRDSMPVLRDINIGGTTIQEYDGDEGTTSLPFAIKYSTNEIPEGALKYQESLSSIVLPTNIVSIGKSAFEGCISLSHFTIPSGVSSIQKSAFENCSSLKSIILSVSIKEIEESAFEDCRSLSSIILPNSLTNIAKSTFENCTGLISITIPTTITTIEESAFEDCRSLASIIIPSSVTTLGKYVFENCRNLAEINIPSSVTKIGSYAFKDCRSLKKISLPSTITSIGKNTFEDCRNLGTINIPETVTSINNEAFIGCRNLTALTLAASTDTIENDAFVDCSAIITIKKENPNYSSLNGIIYNKNQDTLIHCPSSFKNNLIIPKTVTTIGKRAFENCNNLDTIKLHSSVKKIKKDALKKNSGFIDVEKNNPIFSSIDGVLFNKAQDTLIFCPTSKKGNYSIPSTVKTISENAFNGCAELSSITILSAVNVIENDAFTGSSGQIIVSSDNANYLSDNGVLFNKSKTELIHYPKDKAGDYSIPSSVTTISKSAFEDCSELTSVTMPSSVISIGKSAFENCYKLSSILFSKSLIDIASRTFEDCQSLSSFAIPTTVKSIGNNAFQGCTKLKYLKSSSKYPTYLGSNDVFYDVNKDSCILEIPFGSKKWYQDAVQWKNFRIIQGYGIEKVLPSVAKLIVNDTINIDVKGYKFDDNSRLYFENSGSKMNPIKTIFKDSVHITLRFVLANTSKGGEYDIVFITGTNDSLRLEKCFRLIEPTEPIDTDGDGYRNVSTYPNLEWIFEHDSCWSWNFELDNDIDAINGSNKYAGKGLKPISNFTGIIDGQGYKIKNLTIIRNTEDYVALISQLNKGVIRNIKLTSCNIQGRNYTASLVGKNNGGVISNCYCSGTITGNENTGGLVGFNNGILKFCYSSAFINGLSSVGGLAGGSSRDNSISQCYNLGKVIGRDLNIGGIIGLNYGKVNDSYNTANIIGAGQVGGICGENFGTISNTYNIGFINGTGNACGAIIGYNPGTIISSFWDKEKIGLVKSNYGPYGKDKTTTEMKSQSTYTNWSFSSYWEIIPTMNDGYPQLKWATNTSLVKSYSPERVANSGSATVTFEGINFDSNTKVYLNKAGQDTLKADTTYTSDTYCSSKFNFNNAALGSWNILVQYPDTTITFQNGLTVEEKKVGQLKIEILGADKIRTGRTANVTIRVTNTGNTTIENPLLFIAIDSKDTTFSAHCTNSDIPDSIISNFKKMNLDIKDFSFIKSKNILGHNDRICKLGTFIFPTLMPYNSYDFPIEIKSKQDISISAWRQESYTMNDFFGTSQNNSSAKKVQSSKTDYNCISSFANCLTNVVGTTLLGAKEFQLFNTAASMGLFTIDQAATAKGARPNSLTKDLGMLIIGTAGSIALTASAPEVVAAGVILTAINIGVGCMDAVTTCMPDIISKFNIQAVSSFDPNDKIGYRSPSGSRYFKEDNSNFTYEIDFENKATATASAQEVMVTDTLDLSKFNVESFRAGSIKIGQNTYPASYNVQENKWLIDMRPAKDLITNVTLTLDKVKGIATWYFRSVDPVTMDWPQDVTLGFLPPNDSIGSGQGSVSFTIDLKTGLASDISVKNKATIVFDTNAPIITPTWENTKDIIAPVSNMKQPEVVNDSIITLKWLGEDNRNGSGVYQYNVYVKKAGDTYAALLTNTSQNSIDFKFIKETQYNFYVTAKDSAGNEEIKTNVPDITFKANSFNVSISRKWDDVLVCNNIEKLFSSYQWYKNDVAITGETKQYYQEIGGLNGSYFVKVITTDGNTGISNTINVTTSAKSIKAYPNPAADNQSFRLEIKATETDLKQAKLTISTLSGQVVLQDSNLQTQMLLNGLPKGCYIIHVRLTNGEQLNEKLMIN